MVPVSCFLKKNPHLEIHAKIFLDKMIGLCNFFQNKLERKNGEGVQMKDGP